MSKTVLDLVTPPLVHGNVDNEIAEAAPPAAVVEEAVEPEGDDPHPNWAKDAFVVQDPFILHKVVLSCFFAGLVTPLTRRLNR